MQRNEQLQKNLIKFQKAIIKDLAQYKSLVSDSKTRELKANHTGRYFIARSSSHKEEIASIQLYRMLMKVKMLGNMTQKIISFPLEFSSKMSLKAKRASLGQDPHLGE